VVKGGGGRGGSKRVDAKSRNVEVDLHCILAYDPVI